MISDKLGEASLERLTSELSGSELHSVLLEVMRSRARDRTPKDVLAQYERDGFSRPATVDQRTSAAIDAHLLAAAPELEAIELLHRDSAMLERCN